MYAHPLTLVLFMLAFLAGCDNALDRPASEVVIGSWTAVDVRAGSGDQFPYDATSAFDAAGILDISYSATDFLLAFSAIGDGRLNVNGLPVVNLETRTLQGTYEVNEGENVIIFIGEDDQGETVNITSPYRLQGSSRMQLEIDRFAIAILLGIDEPVGIDSRLTFRRR